MLASASAWAWAWAWIVAVALNAAATSLPASVDLTLVLPRNDTYDTNTLLPMVFAFSNPSLLPSLQAGLVFNLYDTNNWSVGWVDTLVEPTNPAFVNDVNTTYFSVRPLFEVYRYASSWRLDWKLLISNCSTTSAGIISPFLFYDFGIGYSESRVTGSVYFSTTTDESAGGVQPDVAAAAANTSCGNAGSGPIIAHVEKTLNVSAVKAILPSYFYGDTCAVIAGAVASPVPAVPTSCAVSLDAEAVASISAAATKTACGAKTPVISCPPPTPSSAASSLRLTALSFVSFPTAVSCVAGMVLIIAVLCGLF
ncbi:MAG: hypothetical protein STHCBS139747_005385 [Sporothrix thermara]